jgi:hypothetical protein
MNCWMVVSRILAELGAVSVPQFAVQTVFAVAAELGRL